MKSPHQFTLLVILCLAVAPSLLAQDANRRDGQRIWRSCSSCHCVPDARIPQDRDWLALNKTTTCISGADATKAHRANLISYLSDDATMRPLLIDGKTNLAKGATGTVRVPETAGSAYLKADRQSIRSGSPRKIRLVWPEGKKGRTFDLPVGSYRLISYAFYRVDDSDSRWSIAGSSAEGCMELNIRENEASAIDCLPEIHGNLSWKLEGNNYTFDYFMTNRRGQRLSVARNGVLANPVWQLVDAAGRQVERGTFEVT